MSGWSYPVAQAEREMISRVVACEPRQQSVQGRLFNLGIQRRHPANALPKQSLRTTVDQPLIFKMPTKA